MWKPLFPKYSSPVPRPRPQTAVPKKISSSNGLGTAKRPRTAPARRASQEEIFQVAYCWNILHSTWFVRWKFDGGMVTAWQITTFLMPTAELFARWQFTQCLLLKVCYLTVYSMLTAELFARWQFTQCLLLKYLLADSLLNAYCWNICMLAIYSMFAAESLLPDSLLNAYCWNFC